MVTMQCQTKHIEGGYKKHYDTCILYRLHLWYVWYPSFRSANIMFYVIILYLKVYQSCLHVSS